MCKFLISLQDEVNIHQELLFQLLRPVQGPIFLPGYIENTETSNKMMEAAQWSE